MRTMLGVGVAALVATSGCYFGGDWDSGGSRASWDDGRSGTPAVGGWEDPGGEVPLDVVNARLSGTLGSVRDFSEEPYRVTAYRSYGMDVIRVDATDSASGQWVMAEIHVTGGVGHPVFAEAGGEPLSFTTDGPSYSAVEAGVFVEGIGCSGPAEMEFDYDAPTQSVEAQVFAGRAPDQRLYTFHLTFADGSVADLELELVAPGAGTTGATVIDGSVTGVLDGVISDGAASRVDSRQGEAGTTVTLEHVSGGGEVIRVRVDVDGGLGSLEAGYHWLEPSDGVRLLASTVPFEVDPRYDREPLWIEAEVSSTADARQLVLIAGFEGGDELRTRILYR